MRRDAAVRDVGARQLKATYMLQQYDDGARPPEARATISTGGIPRGGAGRPSSPVAVL